MKYLMMLVSTMLLLTMPTNATFAATSDNACQAAIKSCAIAAKDLKLSAPACKPLRQCKQVCRSEKKVCKTNCRDLKKECKATCKSKYSKGKDFRECKKGCRHLKKSCKKDCKTVKKGCKQKCRLNFKTPACLADRKAIRNSVLKTIPACIKLAQCINQK